MGYRCDFIGGLSLEGASSEEQVVGIVGSSIGEHWMSGSGYAGWGNGVAVESPEFISFDVAGAKWYTFADDMDNLAREFSNAGIEAKGAIEVYEEDGSEWVVEFSNGFARVLE